MLKSKICAGAGVPENGIPLGDAVLGVSGKGDSVVVGDSTVGAIFLLLESRASGCSSNFLFSPLYNQQIEEEGRRRKEEGGRRKEEGGRRKEEGGKRKEVPLWQLLHRPRNQKNLSAIKFGK
jgi:hypothetical protein